MELLKDLKGQVKDTVAEIRRLVYALRPPVLDEFGLVSAIREHVAQYTGPNGMQITFDVTEPMPPLPAAVEVAAYRIALEAFTNIVKHAQASACQIKIKIENNSLLLEVSDNGKGLSAESTVQALDSPPCVSAPLNSAVNVSLKIIHQADDCHTRLPIQ